MNVSEKQYEQVMSQPDFPVVSCMNFLSFPLVLYNLSSFLVVLDDDSFIKWARANVYILWNFCGNLYLWIRILFTT